MTEDLFIYTHIQQVASIPAIPNRCVHYSTYCCGFVFDYIIAYCTWYCDLWWNWTLRDWNWNISVQSLDKNKFQSQKGNSFFIYERPLKEASQLTNFNCRILHTSYFIIVECFLILFLLLPKEIPSISLIELLYFHLVIFVWWSLAIDVRRVYRKKNSHIFTLTLSVFITKCVNKNLNKQKPKKTNKYF